MKAQDVKKTLPTEVKLQPNDLEEMFYIAVSNSASDTYAPVPFFKDTTVEEDSNMALREEVICLDLSADDTEEESVQVTVPIWRNTKPLNKWDQLLFFTEKEEKQPKKRTVMQVFADSTKKDGASSSKAQKR